ncbi:MAG: hypothetical protein DMG32_08240 [Acidobacteria bacterium]|nr:MAG: hypothetical protein DMG32_08240 [Acidobacteriota bacterium]
MRKLANYRLFTFAARRQESRIEPTPRPHFGPEGKIYFLACRCRKRPLATDKNALAAFCYLGWVE